MHHQHDIFPPGFRPCPVDGCTQPHRRELSAVYSDSRVAVLPVPPPPGDVRRFPELAAVYNDALTAAVARQELLRTERACDVHDRHAATHTPAEYLATIHRLELELGQVDCGIRPHREYQRVEFKPLPEDLKRLITESLGVDLPGHGPVT